MTTPPSPDRPTIGSVWRGNHSRLEYTVISADEEGVVEYRYGNHGHGGVQYGDWFAHWTFIRYGPSKPQSVYRVVAEIR